MVLTRFISFCSDVTHSNTPTPPPPPSSVDEGGGGVFVSHTHCPTWRQDDIMRFFLFCWADSLLSTSINEALSHPPINIQPNTPSTVPPVCPPSHPSVHRPIRLPLGCFLVISWCFCCDQRAGLTCASVTWPPPSVTWPKPSVTWPPPSVTWPPPSAAGLRPPPPPSSVAADATVRFEDAAVNQLL